ncbi:(acyl)-sn-glycerol-3-phosphate acyltransferase and acyl-(acyl carrier protein) ligase, major facilitator superfamily domain-containing [Geotalea daltonii FRC-32]|uniref:(Acyl)-sn-glycerol-3-phosphate acyltransferase and acyl-(Acyl carrier protein) ligase, major facilitator superfamily domain-containing n=1 Tax=Geotalea daltonii (strain DSM 22248 / JCM 15807 / FRC-32) TaxID=316067 RepID=B9M7Z4_GEODF|nr:acyl-[ACP]--phospholipid O-acyltransferase [Geotalea daltonii]ACM18452.1 (acyl)-sn-glycerol-3-phosphate acyltransferase and acyl-(acyl carrier protein) ligase, major facilitator superfamily domain-containing [Geotalea daltonii FRC-32]
MTSHEKHQSLLWLNTTQFLGALNDNILKLLIIFFLIGSQGVAKAGVITACVGAAFVLPFLLFSAPAGCLADRLHKSRLIKIIKAIEVAVTLLAVVAFAFKLEWGLYAVVFLMATHSAFFAPAKYGIIPEIASRDDLSRVNGLIESFTYLAIIVGTALASVLAQATGGRFWIAALVCLVVALVGLASASRLETTRQEDASRKVSLFPSEILRTVLAVRHDRDLMLAIIGLAYFMFVGAFAQLNLISYGMQQLGLSEAGSGYLFLAAALGIGGGSLLAAKLSGRDVEFGIVPIGAIGLTASAILLHTVPSTIASCVFILVLFGISAGLFSLPLQTFIQFRAEPDKRGEVLAASSFINWVGILLASALTWLFSGPLQLSAAQGFSVIGIMTLALTIITLWLLPDFLLRFMGLVTMRIFYRLRIIGAENLPVEGPALLIPNHVTWVDALLLSATCQRRIRFVMERRIYNTPLLRWLFRMMGVIPVSSKDGRKEMVEFIKRARTALDDGYMVCIFAEGALTRNGMLREFRGGFERIVKDSGYPVIPVYIGGAWGSILSYAHGKLLSRPPALAPYQVSILFGTPMPATSTALEVRQAVMELSCDYFNSRKAERKPLAEYFVLAAKQNWKRHAVSDTSGKELSYGETLAGALALAGKLDKCIGEAEYVGLLLPPSAGGALANLALSLLGRVPVNLNYTAAEASLRSAIAQCGITTIVTSRAFLEKLPTLPQVEGMLFLDDIAPTISKGEKLQALIRGRLLPPRLLCNRQGFHADRTATVIFSSGSTGEPKGVMLSHHNIMSNIEALRMVFRVNLNDNICSALPFFHSLGFTGTLWLPLLSGFSAAYHPNPMDGEKIAQVVREHRSSLLIATPTFLLAYLRRAKKEDFASLRLVITGAEKLKAKVADSFEERFGIRPLEGYGATELSPVITLSLPDVKIDGVAQHGSKEGSVGHPIPGVAIRVVDPDSGTALKPGEPGLILVKGPNVMHGYLGQPDKTAQVVKDGWYVTGDIGIMDDDGFIRITDRMSRFSKIGGEMVPHGVVEDELHGRLGQTQVLAVTAVPDEKKGEKLVVVYAKDAADGETLHRLLAESNIPNLWKPGRDCYVAVEDLPMLGSGKLDLKGLKEIALTALGG